MKFGYCPICGSHHFEINSDKSRKCENCGFEMFMNPSAANVAFIMNDKGELLVEKRLREPAKGTLDLPGGFCDMYETAEEGIRREIKEETDIDVKDIEYLFSIPNIYRYSGIDIHTLDMFYLCRIKGDVEIHAADDASECFWLPISEIHSEQFGLRSIRQAIYQADFLKNLK